MSNFNLYPGGLGFGSIDLDYLAIEAADPGIMQTRVQDVLNRIGAGGPNQIPGTLREMSLSGAGDGHAFVTVLLLDRTVDTPVTFNVAYYLAASEAALPAAAQAALLPFADDGADIVAHALSGASQGTRWMGAFVLQRGA